MGQFSNLHFLDVSDNSLEGTISEVHLSELHNLSYLSLSFNSLALNFTPHWIPPFQLFSLFLGHCNTGGHFPSWLQTQSNLEELDLSDARISDELPHWFWDWSQQLGYLNLSHNQINGYVRDFSPNSSSTKFARPPRIDISFNNFSGHLPLLHPNTSDLLLSHNMFSGSTQSLCTEKYDKLQVLDLSKNQFSGELPNCWENTTTLAVLNLEDNNFSGHIPPSLGSLEYLSALQLRNNNLRGEFPSTLKNCSYLQLIDGGGNELTGNFPMWIGELTELRILSLHQNNFSGSIPSEICRLSLIQVLDLSVNNLSGKVPLCFNNFTSLVVSNKAKEFGNMDSTISSRLYVYRAQVQWKRQELEYKSTLGLLKLIDLSGNKLVGDIPQEIYSLSGLVSLNLSQNLLTGNISSKIHQMEMLESLDLSRNNLSGRIPIGLGQLTFLSVLDLSSNNFSGEIPKSTQLQSFDRSSYAGNMELCGEPLPRCPQDSPSTNDNPGNEEDVDDKRECIISAVLGFVIGFWFVIGPLLYSISWRNAYFGYLSKIVDWLYLTVAITHTRLRNCMKRAE